LTIWSAEFYPEQARKELPAGVATGMAWTEMGGEVLFIEATLLQEVAGLTITGQTGEVMQGQRERHSPILVTRGGVRITAEMFKDYGVHLTCRRSDPKDGPSAG